jgi:hypothetical protein
MYHDRSHFFKYVTIDGLRHIAGGLSRQWTSPLAFNDPFDAQFDCGFPFDFDEFGEAFLDALEVMVFGEEEPNGDLSDPMFEQIMISRKNRNRRNRAEFRAFFQGTVDRSVPYLKECQIDSSRVWTDFLKHLRILCLTESNTNLLMWAHYADNHTGAAIRFRCIPEKDSPLLAAVPVKYTNSAPYIGSLDEWIRHLTGQQKIDYDAHFLKLVTTKSPHWEYEQEWRLINFAPKSESENLYLRDRFWPEEIEAIYFGCRSSSSDIEEIRNSMHAELGHVEFYRAKTKQWEFGLEYEQI